MTEQEPNLLSEQEQRRFTNTSQSDSVVRRFATEALINPGMLNNRPMSDEEVKRSIAVKYPSLTGALMQSSLPAYEVIKSMRFAAAYDAATAMTRTGNPYRQAQIFNTMGPDMQGVVTDILQNWKNQADENAARVKTDSTGNAVMDVGRTIWSYTAGPALDTLWKANQLAVRAATTAGYISGGVSPSEAWKATTPGVLDPSMVKTARATYGDKTVDVILALKDASRSDNPDSAVGALYQKYSDEGNVEALAVLDETLFGVNANPKTQDAITYLTSAETGNLGNLVFWSMIAPFVKADSQAGVQAAQNPFYTGIRDTSNVVGTFAFDPTLIGGKISKSYMAARYGLRMLEVGGVETAFQRQAVRTFFDSLGSGLAKVEKADNQVLKAQTLNSVRSQYKAYFNEDALNLMLKAGVRDADTALNFFRGAENLKLLTAGQKAQRSLQVPHMLVATAQYKRASLAVRGLTYDKTGAAAIDSIFGMPVSTMLPADAIPVIIDKLSQSDGDQFVGRMLSDFVFADSTAKRTFLGTLLDTVTPTGTRKFNRKNQAVLGATAPSRYGFRRQGGFRARTERVSRLMAHYPVVDDGLRIVDGRDAGKVRDLLLYFGMPKYWADYGGMLWREMDEAQRIRFASGIGRSGGYALGIDIVDPVNGKTLIDNMVMGLRDGELYAPDQRDLVALRGTVDREVNATMLTMAVNPANKLVTKTNKDGSLSIVKTPESKALYRSLFDKRYSELAQQAPVTNPSRALDETTGATNALYQAQMTDRIAFPNLSVLDQMGMRQSYLTALIGTNPTMTTVTDWWTLATLAGPRFSLRNGIEDAVLFGATGGNWNGFRWGMKYKNAKREATLRPEKVDSTKVRGEKLGVGITASRYLGDIVPTRLQGMILPHLSSKEIQQAATLGARGDRGALVSLIRKALLRQKLTFINDGKFAFLRRAQNTDELTAAQRQIVDDLDDAAEHSAFFNLMDEASESTSHLYDGRPPTLDTEMGDVIVNGVPMRTITVDRTFRTLKTQKGDPQSIRAWYDNLTMILHGDGGKGQKAVGLITKYYWAKRKGSVTDTEAIVDEFAQWIGTKTPWVQQRSGIAATEGLHSFARRNLDDVLRVFTTKRGGFNSELFDKIRRVEVDPKTGEKYVTYALWDKDQGQTLYRLTESDLLDIKGRPQTVLDQGRLQMVHNERAPFTTAAWNMMGRSMARLTREPIFVSNYLEARNDLRPLQRVWAAQFGDDVARQWATEAGYERALNVTMSFVDNPAVRSQMAWNVRNVARFYRATEDFTRRMIRVTKFQPMAFQRINLGWRVFDDTGVVQTNEYGDKYFVWPTSRVAFDGISWLAKQFGADIGGVGLPLNMVSNVAMFTPSADPNSWAATFSGPYASFALKPLVRMTPGLSSLEQELFGEYSSSQSYWDGLLPPHINRLINTYVSLRQGQNKNMTDTDSMFASTARAAIQATLAAGLVDETKPMSDAEKRDILSYINVASIDIMLMKFALGFVLPAATSVEPDTVTPFARDIGVSGMREAFVQLLKANPDDPGKAYITWMKANPGRSIFTVSTYRDNPDIGSFEPFTETVKFMEENQDLIREHPVGSAFFAPQQGTQNLTAWSYLRAMDAKIPKSVNDYFNDMTTAEGYAMYTNLKKQYEDAVSRGEGDVYAPKWKNAKDFLRTTFPGLGPRIDKMRSKEDYAKDVEDVRGAVTWMAENRSLDKRGKDARQVLSYYDQAVQRLAEVTKSDPNYAANRKRVVAQWRAMYEDAKTWYPNDNQWEFLLNATSGALKITVTK